MLKFKSVTFKNFMSYKEASLDLDNKGLVLIEGVNDTNASFKANGAGKTTLAEAIVYALYGTTLRGGKADDVINREVGKGTAVFLELEKDGTAYRIERYRKHGTNRNGVKLFQGDQELTQKSASATNEMILKLIGIDFYTFVNSVMYGQGNLPMFTTATDKGKKEILETVTGIGIYQKAQNVAKEKIKEVTNEKQLTNTTIQECKRALDMLTIQEENDEVRYNTEMAHLEEYKTKLANAQEELARFEAEKGGKLAQAKKDLEAKKQAEQTIREELQAMTEELANLKNPQLKTVDQDNLAKFREFEQSLHVFSNKVSEKQYELNHITQEINNFRIQDKCPTCGNDVDVSHLEAHLTEKRTQQASLAEELDKLKALLEQYNLSYQAKKQEIEKETEDVNNFNSQATSRKSSLEVELRSKERELSFAVTEVTQATRVINMIEENEGPLASVNQLNELVNTRSNIKPKLDLTEDKEVWYTKQVKAEESLNSLSTLEENYSKAVTMFSNQGIRSVVLDTVTPFLTQQANKYLSILSGGTLEVEFITQVKNQDNSLSDKFDILIRNGGTECSYSDNSGGEKRRIDLAISFAIQDLLQSKADLKTNLAVYDECFDGLDDTGSENVIALLNDRQKEIGSIFVITHNSVLRALFENVMTVTKKDGSSKITEGVAN